MCGIAGIVAPPGGARDETCKVMAEAIRHRGPDDEGFYSDDGVALAHKRLSIIDLSSGKQPIFNETKELVLVYNGELYNYRELTAELVTAGHVFTTKSDSEAIVHAYEEWGPNCVARFNGMFAFALWDARERTLFMARDRIGIKPFYYHRAADGRFLFASEIKAILADRTVARRTNDAAIADFLSFQNLLDDKTFFDGVTELPPGSWAIYSKGKLRTEKYWEIDFGASSYDEETACERFREVMSASVKRHLLSDVPLGSYLSGGFDSSTVAYFAAQAISEPLTSFTGAFVDEPFYDERPLSRAVASTIGANMREVVITSDDFRNLMESVMFHLDEPSIGSGALPQFMVSRLVGQHVKVVLTGHGGDEAFCGYQVFKAHRIRSQLNSGLGPALSALASIKSTELFHVLYFSIFTMFDDDLKHGLFIMNDRSARKKLFGPRLAGLMEHYNPSETLMAVLPDQTLPFDRKLTYLYLKTYLPTLLVQEDKVGMAHSIEARIPYCDNEMIRFALDLDTSVKLHGGQLKYVVRNAMRGLLPDSLYGAPKRGFPTPIADWFRGPLRGWVTDMLTGPNARLVGTWIEPSAMKRLIDRFMGMRSVRLYDYAFANRIYSLLSLEIWHRKFFE